MKLQAPNLKRRMLRWCGWLLGAGIFFEVESLAPGASLEIQITPRFSGESIQAGALRYQTSAGETFSITRVSYLLSGLALQRGDGSWLELTNQVAWFDLEKGRSTLRRADVPAEVFRSIRFYVGPDEKDNHADIANFSADHPLNPNLNGLHWSWQGGYIFLALEGMWQERRSPNRLSAGIAREPAGSETGAPLGGWSYHLARDPNRTLINLAAPLDFTRDTKLELDFDLAALLNAPRPLSFARDGSSTHSRDGDPVAAALVANLPGAFRVRRVSAVGVAEIASTKIKPLYLPRRYRLYGFQMSSLFPIPELPRDNPLIVERIELGEKLFHESALSRDGTISCASCHQLNAAFSDPRKYSVGVRDQIGTRNAMPLFNLAWKNSFFWDGRAPSLRAQALMPIEDHTEMDETLTSVVAKLQRLRSRERQFAPSEIASSQRRLTSAATNEVDYPALFAAAFGSPEITPEKIGLALEQFVLTLTSFDSKLDRVLKGQAKLAADEQRGFELFMTEYDPRHGQPGADCFHCHGGPLFQSQTFANNGLDAQFADPGRAKVTGKDADQGKFAVPSLRNVALTSPYMHDGRFKTLEEVVEHYVTGVQRGATLDPNLAKHPNGGVPLNAQDQQALVAFLRTLTDDKYLAKPTPEE